MSSVKDKILETVRELPDDATVEDAIERLYFLAKISKGFGQLDAGQGVPHDVAKKQILDD